MGAGEQSEHLQPCGRSPTTTDQTTHEELVEAVRDELAHWPIGTGYYRATVGVDEAGEMVQPVLDALAQRLPETLAEYAMDGYHHGYVAAIEDVRRLLTGGDDRGSP